MRMMNRLIRPALATLLSTAALPAAAACEPLLSAGSGTGAVPRDVTARDLIELRDIGDPESGNFGLKSRLAVSPNGARVAFSLIQADLAGNGYCQGVFVVDARPGAVPRQISSGGEFIPASDILRGYYTPSGTHEAVIPAWSPDGTRLAFLRRDNGRTQAWIVGTDGAPARRLSDLAADVTALAWSIDGRRVVVASRPALADAAKAIVQEGRSGWLYDARVVPEYKAEPMLAADVSRKFFSIDVDTGRVIDAGPADAARMPEEMLPGVPVPPAAMAPDGRRAWTERDGGGIIAPLVLSTADAAGRTTRCAADWCKGGILNLWWDGGDLFVFRREGWNKENVALYRWTPGATTPRLILRRDDDIQDCGWATAGLVCTAERPTQPRRIVLIDRESGRMREVFDPNPNFKSIRLGSVQRLRTRNAYGLASWADLVLPPGHRRGEKLPLIVVQYRSQGFLRGGTGDEYPIHLLAARGFAVLSLERPPSVSAAFPNVTTAYEINRLSLKDWAERRSILSSVLAHVDQAIATGAVDPKRIGITGQSDGASSARFAMINSTRFATAAISTCCFEPKSVMAYDGIALSDYLQSMGFPPAIKEDRAFWSAYSLAYSGDKTDTPLLMQLADREMVSGLEAFEAMREYGKAVEMYVFPDEYHVKWQPEHRAAVYQRNIDWFAFWLQGKRDPDPSKAAQYARWDKMRTKREVERQAR